ncbi:MAG: hypothetical protein ABSG38_01775 [Spirochaetia bacterium]
MKRSVVSALIAGMAGAVFMSFASAQVQAASQSFDSNWNQTGKSYPAAQFTKPMPWAAGQYVVTGTTTNGTRKSVARTLLVRQEQGGWVIETSTISGNGEEQVTQMLITGFDQMMATGDASAMDLVWIKTLKNGKVTTTQGAQLGFMKGLYKGAYENILTRPSGLSDGGAIAVPAGSFAGTSTVKTSMKVMVTTIEVQTWLNPAVPVNGMVKSMTTDGKTVIELLSFGTDGVPRIQ